MREPERSDSRSSVWWLAVHIKPAMAGSLLVPCSYLASHGNISGGTDSL